MTKKSPIIREVTIGPCRLIQGDCLEVLPLLPKVGAVIADPPYGVGLKYLGHDDGRDSYLAVRPLWKAAIDAATDGPRLISCGVANIGVWEQPNWVIAWLKPAAMGRCVVGFNSWEPVLLYGKSQHTQCDSFVAMINPEESADGHPCPKPIKWAIEQIERYTTAETILDPFMGSGTTGVACIRTGRQFIGIEKEPKYFDIAVQRIRKEYHEEQRRFIPSAKITRSKPEGFLKEESIKSKKPKR